jgi:hypothetical protein
MRSGGQGLAWHVVEQPPRQWQHVAGACCLKHTLLSSLPHQTAKFALQVHNQWARTVRRSCMHPNRQCCQQLHHADSRALIKPGSLNCISIVQQRCRR